MRMNLARASILRAVVCVRVRACVRRPSGAYEDYITRRIPEKTPTRAGLEGVGWGGGDNIAA